MQYVHPSKQILEEIYDIYCLFYNSFPEERVAPFESNLLVKHSAICRTLAAEKIDIVELDHFDYMDQINENIASVVISSVTAYPKEQIRVCLSPNVNNVDKCT